MRINLLKPITHAFPDFGVRTVLRVFELATGGHAEFEGAVQLSVERVQPPRYAPEFRNFT